MAQTTYAPMFVWAVLVYLNQMINKKEERRRTHLPLLDLSASPQVKKGSIRGSLYQILNLKSHFIKWYQIQTREQIWIILALED